MPTQAKDLRVNGSIYLYKDEVFDTIHEGTESSTSWLVGINNPTITIRKGFKKIAPYSNFLIAGEITFTGDSGTIEIDAGQGRIYTEDAVRFSGNTSLIKTGREGFYISNREIDINGTPVPHVTHQLGSITIKEGLFSIGNAEATVTGPIEVYANASLELFQPSSSNVKGEIFTKAGGGNPELRLRGTKTAPATLFIDNNNRNKILKQGFEKLHVTGRATIDFSINSIQSTNILYIDELIFSDPDSLLTIKGWSSGFSHILLKKDWGDARVAELLSKIYFEDYGQATAWEDSKLSGFDDYWEIRPFATPEPATYGAILAATGLGLAAWHKRRRVPKTPLAE